MIEFLSRIDIAPSLAAIYLIVIAFMMDTENMISAIVFKAIPFFIGAACLVTVGINAGYILAP